MAEASVNLWRHADFMKLWTSQAISQLGSQVSFLALPLTAVLTVDATAGEMGLLTALSSLPPLVFGLPVGSIVDQRRRRPIIIASDAGRAVLLGIIPGAWLLGLLTIEWLYVIAFLTATLSLIAGLAHQALLPVVVSREQLVDANSKLALSATAAEVAGPSLAGGLVQWLTAPVAIAADAVSYLLSALVLSRLRVREPNALHADPHTRVWSRIRQGLRLALTDERPQPVIGTRGLLNFFNAMLEAVFVLYIVRELGVAVGLVGLAFSIGGIGFLVGAVVPTRLAKRIGVGASMVVGITVVALSDLIVPFAGGSSLAVVGLLATAQFVFGIGLTVFNVHQASLRQALVPPEYLGRVGATIRVFADGMTPIGAILGGLLGSTVGLRETLIMAALGEVLAAVWLWRSPVGRVRELPTR